MFVTVIVKVTSSPNATRAGQAFVTSIAGAWVMSVSHSSVAEVAVTSESTPSPEAVTEFSTGSSFGPGV